MKMKKSVAFLWIMSLFLSMAGCSSGSQGREFFDASSSYFDHFTAEENENAYTVKGTVHYENDGNAAITYIEAEADATIKIVGALEKREGADTEIIYVAPDGTEVKIGDNSSESFETSLVVMAGDGIVRFEGEPAAYDFHMEFELCDGIHYWERKNQ